MIKYQYDSNDDTVTYELANNTIEVKIDLEWDTVRITDQEYTPRHITLTRSQAIELMNLLVDVYGEGNQEDV